MASRRKLTEAELAVGNTRAYVYVILRQTPAGHTLAEIQERLPTADVQAALDRLITLGYVRVDGDRYTAEPLGMEPERRRGDPIPEEGEP